MVVCEEARCKSGEVCAVVEGVRRCVATNRSICVATGDPHYTTFDGHRYDFMGTCVYLLAGLCSPDPTLVPFNVTVENNHRGDNRVSFTKVVTLEVFNVSLSLSQEHPKKVKVDGILLDLPFSHPHHELRVSLRGVHGFITTAFGVTVTFDWHSYARVILPSTFAGAVCGLCGNANGDPHDDFVTRQGNPAHNDTHFGDSWKVSEVPGCSPGCTEGCQGCSNTQRRTYRGDKHCGVLVKKRGPLATCHEVIDPAPFLEDCLFDTCLFDGHHDAVCQAVGAYVSACQSRGVAVGPWRTHAFCSPVCPPERALRAVWPPLPPDLPGRCGCTLEGRYYPRGAQFYPSPSCTQRCVCSRGGHVECESTPGCPPGQECGVRDGVLGCHPRSTCGQCQLLGRGIYSTFGGQLGGFKGSCTLPLLEMDAGDPEEGPQPLKVALEQHEGEVRRVTVTAQGMTVAMDRGQRWEVTVSAGRGNLGLGGKSRWTASATCSPCG
ncbi:IgGFc-binding protein-like [Neopelma chrysocephalum]|uniref:IgGFc-binding protein-like n=1 Tax=Neopelma chrysocephalum TaxID=114329 RepID=UPI000FCD481E|nr:IgGFc-binding protein-like [Neopelma chrysocephalum]